MKKLILAATGVAFLATGAPRALGLTAVLPVASDPVLASAPASRALEFPQEYVPANATLVAHFDLVQFQRTRLWGLVEPKRHELEMDEVVAELGFDPLVEVRSVTVWGTEGEPEAVVVVMSDAIDAALGRFEAQGKLSYTERDGIKLFSFDDLVGYVQVHGPGERVLVMADGAGRVVRAARVLLGDEPSLRDARDAKLHVAPVNGSYLFVAATGILPGMDEFEPASQILGSAQGVQFDLGEAGGSLFAHLALDTGSVEMASDVSDMMQGLLALGRIAIRAEEEVPPEVDELLHALAVRSRGGVVSADFEYSVDALFQILESLED